MKGDRRKKHFFACQNGEASLQSGKSLFFVDTNIDNDSGSFDAQEDEYG